MGGIIGGSSEQESSSESASRSGFDLLPEEIQQAWKQYGSQVGSQFASPQDSAFTPISATEGEQSALQSMYGGYTPTEESLSSDISMLMNPYNESVIDEINRQSGGDYSALQQQLNEAGQFGSNRANLGASDIDLARTNQIGQFLQSQYNTAIGDALTTLPSLRQASDQSALSAGGFERSLGLQQAQAPISALQSYGSLLGVMPQSGGSQSASSSESFGTSGTGIFGLADQRAALLSRGKM